VSFGLLSMLADSSILAMMSLLIGILIIGSWTNKSCNYWYEGDLLIRRDVVSLKEKLGLYIKRSQQLQ